MGIAATNRAFVGLNGMLRENLINEYLPLSMLEINSSVMAGSSSPAVRMGMMLTCYKCV